MPTQTNFLLLFLCNLKESHPAIFSHIIGHSTIVTLIYRSLDKETKRLIMSILNAKKYVDETISYTKLNTLNIIDLFNGADGCYIKINQNFRQILLNNFSQIQFTRNIKTTPIEFNSKLLANQKDTCTNAISIHEHYSEIGLLDSGSRLTSKGLEFLLLSKNEQMWYIITSFMRRHISDNEAGIEYLVEWAMILNGVYDYMEVTNTFSMLDEIGIIKIDGDSYRVNSTILFGTAVAANRFIYLETSYTRIQMIHVTLRY
ncbi:hypothetical protein ECANGB1_1464 [Enterospora canceri]|uniref:Uncharacterized protein n=1 Tax=Enterospora canceri TaxID=1081671 RepID=A0A1Y1S6R0_9MICR|nr:hypothetical protein ECANGB1_1464 [Enterospora canceri]